MKPRNVTDVVTGMLAHIPEAETGLRANLRRVAEQAGYDAPEVGHAAFRRLTVVFNEFASRAGWTMDTMPRWAHQAGRVLANMPPLEESP